MDALLGGGCGSSGGGTPLGNLVDGLLDQPRVAEQAAAGLVHRPGGPVAANAAAAAHTAAREGAAALGLFSGGGAEMAPLLQSLEPEPEPQVVSMQRVMTEAHRSELARMGRGAGLLRSHPTVQRQGDTISKVPGAPKGWATAILPTVMRCGEGGRVHFLDAQVGTSNQLMVGVCRPDFDPLAGAPTDVGISGQHGAAFTTEGWSYYCFNGASYHDQPRGPLGADHHSMLGKVMPGGTFSIALDCGAGTLDLYREGVRVGRICEGLTGDLCFSVQLLHPDAAIKASITEPGKL